MAGRQQTAPPQQRRSKDDTAHPPPPGTRPEPPHPDPAHSSGLSQTQDCRAATHGLLQAEPGTSPRFCPTSCRNPPRHAPCQQTTGWLEGRCPVVSNRPLHRAMQQRCHHASASAWSQSSAPIPRPRLQRAATPGQRRLLIVEQNIH